MKLETLKERIANAEEKSSKKRATIEKKINWRFAKMAKRDSELDPNEKQWLEYEIDSLCNDIDRLTKEVDEIESSLAKYREQLAKEIEKENSRNVTAIIEFLDKYGERVFTYYQDSFTRYKEELSEFRRREHEHCEWFNHGGWDDPNRKEIEKKYDAYRKHFKERWTFLFPYLTYRHEFDADKLRSDIEYDKKAKYDDIIERTNTIVGTITDASKLTVGNKGELNGVVVGDRGKAKVETIGAGGYNIQCFHFRTLIHELK